MRYCFENIIGYKEEKEELEIMASALSKMAESPKSNSYCPRGLLLAGDPGLGKTFFAKTLIDEVDEKRGSDKQFSRGCGSWATAVTIGMVGADTNPATPIGV